MATLNEQLLTLETRPTLVKECVSLIDAQVRAKRGFSGIAIKTAYKAVTAIKRGFVPGVVDALLDDWVDKLEPFYGEHVAAGGTVFADFVGANKARVAEALIEVTDERARTTKHKTAKKFYDRLRPSALANVEVAVPDLARLVDSHLAGAVEPAVAATGSEG